MPRARGGSEQQPVTTVGDRSPTVTTTVGPGGIVTAKCPDCGVEQSLGALTKEGGCRMCEAPMRRFFPAEDRTIPIPGTETPAPAKTPPLPGAEPRPGDPTCEECGARLTISGEKFFCPDVSLKPHKSEVKVAASPDAPLTLKPSPETQAVINEVVKETVLKRENAWRQPMPSAESSKPWDAGEQHTMMTVAVGKMTFAPQQYHSFELPQLSATVPREVAKQALEDLRALQAEEFEKQYASYQAFMQKLYGEKGKRG